MTFYLKCYINICEPTSVNPNGNCSPLMARDRHAVLTSSMLLRNGTSGTAAMVFFYSNPSCPLIHPLFLCIGKAPSAYAPRASCFFIYFYDISISPKTVKVVAKKSHCCFLTNIHKAYCLNALPLCLYGDTRWNDPQITFRLSFQLPLSYFLPPSKTRLR